MQPFRAETLSEVVGQLGLGDTMPRGDSSYEMGDALPTVKLFSDLW
jgi:hypothetical protein